jgi:hypothetical protein
MACAQFRPDCRTLAVHAFGVILGGPVRAARLQRHHRLRLLRCVRSRPGGRCAFVGIPGSNGVEPHQHESLRACAVDPQRAELTLDAFDAIWLDA